MTKSPRSNACDAIIIGAGIAFELANTGRKVLAVDKNPAARYGSTSSSSAVIRTFYSTRDGCALAWEGLHVWRDWKNFLGLTPIDPLTTYVECPALVLQNGVPDGRDLACRHLTDLNVPLETWSPEKLVQQFPGFDVRCFAPPRQGDHEKFGTPTGALYFPDGGYVTDPQLAAHNLQQAAETFGAEFLFNARVAEPSHAPGAPYARAANPRASERGCRHV